MLHSKNHVNILSINLIFITREGYNFSKKQYLKNEINILKKINEYNIQILDIIRKGNLNDN